MKWIITKHNWFGVLVAILMMIAPEFCFAQNAPPIFMSLKSNRVLMRVGPGKMYPAIWEYRVKGLPLEVMGKHNNEWFQVRDADGEIGWIYARLLSSTKTGMVMYDDVLLHYNPDNNSPVLAKLRKNVIVVPQSCRATWCDVNVPYNKKTYKGWIRKQYLWGILPTESFEE
jgi:SH3-like domain-containing protein